MINKDNKHYFIAPFRSITSIAVSTYVVIFVVGVLSESKPEYIFPTGALLGLLSFPGFCLGLIQSKVLSQHTSKKPFVWFIITTGSAALGCGLIVYLFKHVLTKDTIQNLINVPHNEGFAILKSILLSSLLGCIIGSIVGLTQGLLVYKKIDFLRWLLITILYWCIGFAFPLVCIYSRLSGGFGGFE